jgi:hypothetical protein
MTRVTLSSLIKLKHTGSALVQEEKIRANLFIGSETCVRFIIPVHFVNFI